MPIEIKMPALSPTMEEGTLARWLVKPGDEVSAGDIMAEIETDKATMEFEAVDEGVIGKILVPEGTEGVKVNSAIADIRVDPVPTEQFPRPATRPPRGVLATDKLRAALGCDIPTWQDALGRYLRMRSEAMKVTP